MSKMNNGNIMPEWPKCKYGVFLSNNNLVSITVKTSKIRAQNDRT